MSRTYAHKPIKIIPKDCDGLIDPWMVGYDRLSNIKQPKRARDDRRRIRHAMIDEDGIALVSAIAEYKSDILARNRYW